MYHSCHGWAASEDWCVGGGGRAMHGGWGEENPPIALQAAPEAQEWVEGGGAGAGGACVIPAGYHLHLCQL